MIRNVAFLYILLFSYQLKGQQNDLEKLNSLKIEIENAFYTEGNQLTDPIFNVNKLIERIVENCNNTIPEEILLNYKSGSLLSPLESRLEEVIESGGYINHLDSVYIDGTTARVPFRNYSDKGINYLEIIFQKTKSGNWEAYDIFSHLSGEYVSETMGHFLENNLNQDSTTLSDMQKIQKVSLLRKDNKYYEAKLIFDSISEKRKKEKPFLLIELQLLTLENNPERYLEIIELLRNDGAPITLHLLSIDKYYFENQYSKVLAAIDSIDYYIKDDFLDLLRSNVHFLDGNLQLAINAVERLRYNYPYLSEGFDLHLNLLYESNQLDNMVEELQLGIATLDLDKIKINELVSQIYPNLNSNIKYQNWMMHVDDQFKKMKSSLIKQLKGNWTFINMVDTEGNSITRRANEIIKRPNYRFMENLYYADWENQQEQGFWEVIVPDGDITLNLKIDPTSKIGQSLINNQLAFKHSNGNYYEPITKSIIYLHNNEMLISDGDQYLHYKRDNVPDNKYFTGRIIYLSDFTSLDSTITEREIQDFFGTYTDYYYDGVRYKSETSGEMGLTQIYLGNDTIYNFYNNIDTIYFQLSTEDEDPIINYEIIDEGPKILMQPTQRYFYQTLKESNEIYYSPSLKIDPQTQTNHTYKNFNSITESTESLPLIFYYRDDKIKSTYRAAVIINMEIDNSIFELPNFPRVALPSN